MRIKRFSHRFKKSYGLVAVMMITVSLLGVSYGYWSDISTVDLKIITPQIKLIGPEDKDNSKLLRVTSNDMIEIDNNSLVDAIRFLTFDIEQKREDQENNESDILLKYDDCEVYYISSEMTNYDDQGTLLQEFKPEVSSQIKIEDGYINYQVKIEINILQLKSALETHGFNSGEGTIKIGLNFKQDLTQQDGWQYFVEKEYKVAFINDPVADDGQGRSFGVGMTEGTETKSDSTLIDIQSIDVQLTDDLSIDTGSTNTTPRDNEGVDPSIDNPSTDSAPYDNASSGESQAD